MFRLLASGITLVGVMALAAVFGQSAGNDPALSRADSVLPPPSAHLFYLSAAHARFIRWDCSDWQPHPAVADAEDELASSILETLAANRGKTLYCALDQSDTWTKRQVYDNAHAHNDRDRTQYDGSQGQGRFRGFTAGQEGWLTDGEHGITGVSPERIFEFPEQKRRRRWKTVTQRLKLDNERLNHPFWSSSGWSTTQAPALTDAEYHKADEVQPALNSTILAARKNFCQSGNTALIWDTSHATIRKCANLDRGWPELVPAECESRGYPRARNIVITDPGAPDGDSDPGIGHWEYERYSGDPGDGSTAHGLRARQWRYFSATCEKRVRVRR